MFKGDSFFKSLNIHKHICLANMLKIFSITHILYWAKKRANLKKNILRHFYIKTKNLNNLVIKLKYSNIGSIKLGLLMFINIYQYKVSRDCVHSELPWIYI